MTSNVLSWIAIIISLASLFVSIYFGWYRIKKERPLLEHEIIQCKHNVTKDGQSTDLVLFFKLHNRGDRGTQLNRIEVYATDFSGKEHQSSYDLSEVKYLDATDSTNVLRVLFRFSPYFQYKEKMPCKFIVHHTTGKYTFKCESEESEVYIGIHMPNNMLNNKNVLRKRFLLRTFIL